MHQSHTPPKKLTSYTAGVGLALLVGLSSAHAGFLLDIDTDGADDGVLTYNSHFSFGGDTTTASQSALSLAFGMTGGDSIFGGNGVNSPDTYRYTYNPATDADNLVIPEGTDLNGYAASGLTGGSPGKYAVFATWPFSANVSGGLTKFTATTAGDSFVLNFDQAGGGAGTGDLWYKLGEITWTGGPIDLVQEATSNTFVSMRAAGVLFELVPEPSTISLLALGALGLAGLRRKTRA